MKRILSGAILSASLLVGANVYAHCGKCATDTCESCACKMGTTKEACDAKAPCTCNKGCTCVKAKCPCTKKRCCNKQGKVEKHVKHHEHHEPAATK